MAIEKTKRKLILELFGGRCAYCHASVALDEMTITANGAFLKLEAEKRKAERRIKQISMEMDRKAYTYVRYLRGVLGDKTLKGFGGTIPGSKKNQ